MKKYAVIVAGGTGIRMGADLPKQFLLLKDKPVLYYSIKVFLDAYDDLEVILVLPEEFVAMGKEIVDGYFDAARVHLVIGGETRFHSVKNGLALIQEESVVFVHDAVRCLVTDSLVKNCYELTLQTGNAIPTIPSKDSVRIITEEGNMAIDRNTVMLIQTPQTFHSKILLPAYEISHKEQFTDEATVVEAFGLKISLVEGEETNIKITRPIDMIIADKILSDRNH